MCFAAVIAVAATAESGSSLKWRLYPSWPPPTAPLGTEYGRCSINAHSCTGLPSSAQLLFLQGSRTEPQLAGVERAWLPAAAALETCLLSDPFPP